MELNPDERQRIEQELEANGFVSIHDVPFSVKQLALLNWHNVKELHTLLDELRSEVQVLISSLDTGDGFVRQREFAEFRKGLRNMMVAVGALVGVVLTIGASFLLQALS